MRQLCTSGLLLEKGKVVMSGTANGVADLYLQNMLASKRLQLKAADTGYTEMRLVNSDGATITVIVPDQQPAFVEVGLRISTTSNIQAGFTIYNQLDIPLVLCASEYGDVELKPGQHVFRIMLPNKLLQPGTYRIEGAVWDAQNVFPTRMIIFAIFRSCQNTLMKCMAEAPRHSSSSGNHGSRFPGGEMESVPWRCNLKSKWQSVSITNSKLKPISYLFLPVPKHA